MMRSLLPLVAVVTAALLPTLASGQTNFSATLETSQEVSPPPVPLGASGTATLTLNAAQDRLTMSLQLTGVDLDGNQTVSTSDNVTNLHIHAAPAGLNGGVVFGLIGPNHDLNGDLVINPVAGTIFSAWDLNEGNGTTLAAQLTNLFNEGLYFNVHTNNAPGGEIRGQIVPEPTTLALLALGLTGLMSRRGRRLGAK